MTITLSPAEAAVGVFLATAVMQPSQFFESHHVVVGRIFAGHVAGLAVIVPPVVVDPLVRIERPPTSL